jgi:hypothetical protein
MDKLLDVFKKFEKSKIGKEQNCLIVGGDAGTCGDEPCCQETAGTDTRTDDVCTGDKCDPDDGPDLCV